VITWHNYVDVYSSVYTVFGMLHDGLHHNDTVKIVFWSSISKKCYVSCWYLLQLNYRHRLF